MYDNVYDVLHVFAHCFSECLFCKVHHVPQAQVLTLSVAEEFWMWQ